MQFCNVNYYRVRQSHGALQISQLVTPNVLIERHFLSCPSIQVFSILTFLVKVWTKCLLQFAFIPRCSASLWWLRVVLVPQVAGFDVPNVKTFYLVFFRWPFLSHEFFHLLILSANAVDIFFIFLDKRKWCFGSFWTNVFVQCFIHDIRSIRICIHVSHASILLLSAGLIVQVSTACVAVEQINTRTNPIGEGTHKNKFIHHFQFDYLANARKVIICSVHYHDLRNISQESMHVAWKTCSNSSWSEVMMKVSSSYLKFS